MNITTILRFTFISQLLTSAIIAFLGEIGWLPTGLLDDGGKQSYLLSMIGVALTIVGLPIALKLLHFSAVRSQVKNNVRLYFKWSVVRLAILYVPLAYNILMYYFLGFNVTCGYLALMTLVGYLFVWPSRGRMESECEMVYEEDDKA